ncbi:hypothetical protein EVAR_103590_1 [Eumeta japonica]|uniref:Uncharacterized protein n=1 Tax=Eumeta variegata TaxID=151549 RepID=A0A4C1ZAD1_EUMVA|nr:hypothetical protein EVAR_103590_1 [Eumeta japonica]
MKLVTIASRWRKIGIRGRRRKGREELNLRISLFAAIRDQKFEGRSSLQAIPETSSYFRAKGVEKYKYQLSDRHGVRRAHAKFEGRAKWPQGELSD